MADSNIELPLLNEEQVAELLNCSVSLVRKWRRLKTGPTPCRVGGRLVRYRRAEIERYIRSQISEPLAA